MESNFLFGNLQLFIRIIENGFFKTGFYFSTGTSLYPAVKREFCRQYADKENEYYRKNIIDNRHERALRFLDQNQVFNGNGIYEPKYRPPVGLR